jgi:electron-transferring-flavoprotein dehydrogenase
MTSVALTGTNHNEDEPSHLRLDTQPQFEDFYYGKHTSPQASDGGWSKKQAGHTKINVDNYAGLLQNACPAGVYEYVPDEVGVRGL